MASLNKVQIIGNLGRDPEVRYTPSGTAACTLRVASTRNWKNKTTGEREEATEWHSIVLYDRQAEVAGEYLKKGRSSYVEGRLQTRKWQDKDGVDHYTTEIIASEFQMLGEKPAEPQREAAPQGGTKPAAGKPAAKKAGKGKGALDDLPPLPDMAGEPDDIPF